MAEEKKAKQKPEQKKRCLFTPADPRMYFFVCVFFVYFESDVDELHLSAKQC